MADEEPLRRMGCLPAFLIFTSVVSGGMVISLLFLTLLIPILR